MNAKNIYLTVFRKAGTKNSTQTHFFYVMNLKIVIHQFVCRLRIILCFHSI